VHSLSEVCLVDTERNLANDIGPFERDLAVEKENGRCRKPRAVDSTGTCWASLSAPVLDVVPVGGIAVDIVAELGCKVKEREDVAWGPSVCDFFHGL